MDGFVKTGWKRVLSSDAIPRERGNIVLFQVPNQIGLGHMNRAASISMALRQVAPQLKALFALEGTSHGFLESLGITYVPLYKAREVAASARDVNASSLHAVADAMSDALLRAAQPQLVVFDCFPSKFVLQHVIERGIPFVLCLRDAKSFSFYEKNAVVMRAIQACKLLIVPHTRADSNLPQTLNDRAAFVGDIVRDLPIDPVPPQIRFGAPACRFVVVTAGGGGHETAAAFLQNVVAALRPLVAKYDDLRCIIITGPLFTQWQVLKLSPEMILIPFDPEASDLYATADLVIAQGGYNTVNELAALGSPTLCIPADRGYDDQYSRVSEMSKRHANISVGSHASVAALTIKIEALLQVPPASRVRQQQHSGALEAAELIAGLVTKGQAETIVQ